MKNNTIFKEFFDMFRKMRRFNQEVSKEAAIDVLKKSSRGVLSVIGDDGYPYGIPVNFIYDENENSIYIHGAKEGHKIDSIKRCNKVSFTTWDDGFKKEGDWAWTVTSVIVFGHAELIDDINIITDKVRNLGRKYYPSKDEVENEIKNAIDKVLLISLRIDNITGKTIHEK